MKTILTKEINGNTIIVGFSDPVIDAVATEKLITPLLEDEKELKDIHVRVKEIENRSRMSRVAIREAVKSARSGNNQAKEKFEKEYNQHQSKIAEVQDELKLLREPLRKKKCELIKEHAVYFEPKEGEKIISDEQYNTLSSVEIPNYGTLKMDGTIIYDYSKYDVWLKTSGKWNKIILSFGDILPTGAIVEKDLTEKQKIEIAEQVELDRIASLSQAEKDAEKQIIIDNLAAQAASMRSALEIQGDLKALEKSQDWYNEQVLLVENKYA